MSAKSRCITVRPATRALRSATKPFSKMKPSSPFGTLAQNVQCLVFAGLFAFGFHRLDRLEEDSVRRALSSAAEPIDADAIWEAVRQQSVRLDELTAAMAELQNGVAAVANTTRADVDERLDERRKGDDGVRGRAQPAAAAGGEWHMTQKLTRQRQNHTRPESMPVVGAARGRRAQAAPACDFAAQTAAAMDACCPATAASGGHRRAQASCDLPASCPSMACASVFLPFMAGCGTMLAQMPGLQVDQFESFAASCREEQASMLQPVEVQMFRVRVDTEGAAQSGAMFPSGGPGPSPPLDPLQPLLPLPPPPAPQGAEDPTGVEQYHATCSSADIAACVPACNAQHHGYELLATIDGTDTKFSCNLAHGLFSWMGAASEGGYLGSDLASFFSAVRTSRRFCVSALRLSLCSSFLCLLVSPFVFCGLGRIGPCCVTAMPSALLPSALCPLPFALRAFQSAANLAKLCTLAQSGCALLSAVLIAPCTLLSPRAVSLFACLSVRFLRSVQYRAVLP